MHTHNTTQYNSEVNGHVDNNIINMKTGNYKHENLKQKEIKLLCSLFSVM